MYIVGVKEKDRLLVVVIMVDNLKNVKIWENVGDKSNYDDGNEEILGKLLEKKCECVCFYV